VFRLIDIYIIVTRTLGGLIIIFKHYLSKFNLEVQHPGVVFWNDFFKTIMKNTAGVCLTAGGAKPPRRVKRQH